MDEALRDKLRKKIIEAQDEIVYFWENNYCEGTSTETIPDSDLHYGSLVSDFLKDNLDFVENLSMGNLVLLLSAIDKDVVEAAKAQILKKFDAGEHIFSGPNPENESFGIRSLAWDSVYGKLPEEDLKRIHAKIDEQYEALKEADPKAYSIAEKITTYMALDNFLHYYEKGIITPDKLDFIGKMISENPNILNTINFGVFSDEILEMGEEFVTRVSQYPNINSKLIILANSNPQLFEAVKKGFIDLEQTVSEQEALALQETTLIYATRMAHEIQGDINFEDLVNSAILHRDSYFDKEVDYSENYREEFEKDCDAKYDRSSFVHNKKAILLSKFFGISNYKAEEFFNTYFKNAGQLDLPDGELKDYITQVTRILETEDEAEIDTMYHSMEKRVTPIERTHFEYDLRDAYMQTISDATRKTHESLEAAEDAQFIDFNGHKIKQVKLTGDFSVILHSTDSGFKEEKTLEEGKFLETWRQRKDPSTHLTSGCFVTQDFMGHVPAGTNGVLAVFADLDKSDLSLMGPTDIDSHVRKYDYQAGKTKYMTAGNLAHNAKKVYAEVPVQKKKEPDYFLIFDDTPEDVVQNTYMVAAETGATVLFGNKKDIEQRQLQKLDDLMERFKETGDLSVLQTLVSTYETNVAGWLLNRDPSEQDESFTAGIEHERFRADFDQREARMYDLIDEYIRGAGTRPNARESLKQVASIMQAEIDKYDFEDFDAISKTKMKFDAKSVLDRVEQVIPQLTEEVVQASEAEKSRDSIDLDEVVVDSVIFEGIGFKALQDLTKAKVRAEKSATQKDEGEMTYGE